MGCGAETVTGTGDNARICSNQGLIITPPRPRPLCCFSIYGFETSKLYAGEITEPLISVSFIIDYHNLNPYSALKSFKFPSLQWSIRNSMAKSCQHIRYEWSWSMILKWIIILKMKNPAYTNGQMTTIWLDGMESLIFVQQINFENNISWCLTRGPRPLALFLGGSILKNSKKPSWELLVSGVCCCTWRHGEAAGCNWPNENTICNNNVCRDNGASWGHIL